MARQRRKYTPERINLQLTPELAEFVSGEVDRLAFGAKTEYLRHLIREAMLAERERERAAHAPKQP